MEVQWASETSGMNNQIPSDGEVMSHYSTYDIELFSYRFTSLTGNASNQQQFAECKCKKVEEQ